MFKLKATTKEIDIAKDFIKEAPVAFLYQNKNFPKDFSGNQGEYISNDKLLKCEFNFKTFDESSAIEWTPRFTNIGKENTGRIKDIYAIDRIFKVDGDIKLYYLKGTSSSIDDFSIKECEIKDEPIVFESNGSASYMPFFNLKTGLGGVILGLGFTGYWKASFEKTEDGVRVRVSTGETDFYLMAGESVRSALVLTLFWQGDVRRSFNLLRNHLVINHIPRDENGEPYPPICCNSWGAMKTHNHIKYINFIKENDLKFDVYWMDAGWFAPDHETEEYQNLLEEDWYFYQGDWRPNRCVHPDGLKPIADKARECGMKLLLWFGAYVCCHEIGWHADHPEWAADNNKTYHRIGANKSRKTIMHYINLDIPEARAWLAKRIGDTLSESGAMAYREDCRPPLVPDTVGRIGIGQMKSVEYMYEFWDELRSRVPGLLIDNCGGGGTRIDLETLSRSYVLWRSDYNCHPSADPIGAQVGNYGLGHFIPLVNGAPPSNPGSTYNFHSGIYGGMGFGLFHPVGVGDAEKHTWFADDYPVNWHKRMLEHYQLAKPYLSGNFYPLTECTTKRDDIMSYQFDRPDLKSGIIFTFFRPECNLDKISLTPELEEGRYIFENVESGECFEMDTKHCTKITLRSNTKPESILLHYKVLNNPSKFVAISENI